MNKKIIGLLSVFVIGMILAPSVILAACSAGEIPVQVDISGTLTDACCVQPNPDGSCPAGYSLTGCCKLDTGTTGGGGVGTELPDVGVIDALNNITNYAFYALLLVVVLMLIIAAWMFVTAGSNPETVKKARTMLMMALIGLAVAILAKGTVALVQRIIEGGQ